MRRRGTRVRGRSGRALAEDAGHAFAAGGPNHPAVVQAMRLMKQRPGHRWTLAEPHLTRGYLVRRFKAHHGMSASAYRARFGTAFREPR